MFKTCGMALGRLVIENVGPPNENAGVWVLAGSFAYGAGPSVFPALAIIMWTRDW